ncbi:proton channel OtopLc-like [Branchiostoma floridae x Branchiostoma belcheri]
MYEEITFFRRPSVIGTGRMEHVTYYALGFCGLYGMLLVVVGTVLPISEFISDHLVRPRVDGFFCYLYAVGFAWLLAVFVSGCQHGRCPVEGRKDDLSIFLKCGLVGFGLISVIKAALEVAIYAEYNTMPGCYHVELTSLMSPVGWIFFCLMQMYILLTFEMKQQPDGWRSWFYVLGLMHCVATNLCVWVNTVVHETVEALEHRLNQTVVAEEGHERLLHASHDVYGAGEVTHSTVLIMVMMMIMVTMTNADNGEDNVGHVADDDDSVDDGDDDNHDGDYDNDDDDDGSGEDNGGDAAAEDDSVDGGDDDDDDYNLDEHNDNDDDDGEEGGSGADNGGDGDDNIVVDDDDDNNHDGDNDNDDDDEVDELELSPVCQPVFLQHLMRLMSPMMYPCTIEESLIAAAAFAVAIVDIKEQACGKTPTRQWKILSQTSHYCMSSCKGLVAGVIVLAAVLTTIIIYGFSFGALDHWAASIAYQLTIFMCNIIGIIVTVMAWYYLRSHRSEQHSGAVLDKALLSVALFGVFLLAVLSLISGIMATHQNWSDMLLTWRMGSVIVETSLQTVFIFDGLNRTSSLKEKRPKAVERGLVSFATPGGANGEILHDVVPLRDVLPVRQGVITVHQRQIESPTIIGDSCEDSHDAPGGRCSVSCDPFLKLPFPLPKSNDRRVSKAKRYWEDEENVGGGKYSGGRQKNAPERRRIRKRSRQLVMFLFVLNVTLWLVSVSTLYIPDTLQVQEQFYHHVAWILVTHIALPLLIFYRFHSAACLFEIWNHAYHPHQSM